MIPLLVVVAVPNVVCCWESGTSDGKHGIQTAPGIAVAAAAVFAVSAVVIVVALVVGAIA